MAIGDYFQSGTGNNNFLPRLNCDARTGMLSRINRQQTDDGWVNTPEPLIMSAEAPLNLLMDFANIEVTWQCLDRTIGVNVQAVKYRDLVDGTAQMIARPSEHHKQGFRLQVYNTKLAGVHEFGSTAMCVRTAIDKIHDAYLAEADKHVDECPVVAFTGVTPTSTPRGTNYAPIMSIVGWSSRQPFDDLPAAEVAPAAAPAPAPSPVSSVSAEF